MMQANCIRERRRTVGVTGRRDGHLTGRAAMKFAVAIVALIILTALIVATVRDYRRRKYQRGWDHIPAADERNWQQRFINQERGWR